MATFTVQVLATRARAQAESRVARLKSRGYDAYVVPSDGAASRLHRVRVGSFTDRGSAAELADELRQEGEGKAFVLARTAAATRR